MSKFCSQSFGVNLLIILIRDFMLINDHIKMLGLKINKIEATSFKVLDRLF